MTAADCDAGSVMAGGAVTLPGRPATARAAATAARLRLALGEPISGRGRLRKSSSQPSRARRRGMPEIVVDRELGAQDCRIQLGDQYVGSKDARRSAISWIRNLSWC
jgi:hypothetical protein